MLIDGSNKPKANPLFHIINQKKSMGLPAQTEKNAEKFTDRY